jgi:hypothetical protein
MARSKIGAALTKVRRTTHGPFDQVAKTSWAMLRAMAQTPNWTVLNDTQRMALQEVIHKMSRIAHGDHEHIDHWHDIAGYGELGANACVAAQEAAAKAARKKVRKAVKPVAKKAITKKPVVKKAVAKKPARPRQPLPVDPAPSTHPQQVRQRRRQRRDERETANADAMQAAE